MERRTQIMRAHHFARGYCGKSATRALSISKGKLALLPKASILLSHFHSSAGTNVCNNVVNQPN